MIHNQNVGPKFSHPDLIITLQYNGFAMLFRYWVYFVCLSAMLLFYDKVFVLCTPNVLGLLSLRCAASLFAPPPCVCRLDTGDAVISPSTTLDKYIPADLRQQLHHQRCWVGWGVSHSP